MTDNTRADYDKYMNDLTMRIGVAVDGAKQRDIAGACAAIIGFFLSEIDDEKERKRVMKLMFTFIEICSKKRLSKQ